MHAHSTRRTPAEGTWFHRRAGSLALALVVGMLSVGMPRASQAGPQEESEAKVLFKEGVARLQAADYVGALGYFQSAYGRMPNPKILLNMGTALKQLGRFSEAAECYEKYLAQPGLAANRRAEVAQLAKEMDANVARLWLDGKPEGIDVFIDGRQVNALENGSYRVDPGPHVVEVAVDANATPRRIQVQAGTAQHLDVRSKALPAAADALKARSSAPGEAPSAKVDLPALKPDEQAAAMASQPLWRRWWVWTLAGGVVAAGAALGIAYAIPLDASLPGDSAGSAVIRF